MLLKRTPKITGTVTIKNIWIATINKDCHSFKLPYPNIDNQIIKIIGTVITQRILLIAVNEIESAILPFAYEVRTLLVTPPGAAANIITPIANSGVRGQNKTITSATIGKTIIWKNRNIKKSLGLKKTLVKSFI